MGRSLLSGVAIGLLFLQPRPSVPAQTLTLAQELQVAKDLYLAGSFPQAAVALGSFIARLELRPETENRKSMLLDAHFHLALTYFALNDSLAAKESFQVVIGLEPAYQVDPERYSPGIVALLEEARQEVMAGPGASGEGTVESSTTAKEDPASTEPSRSRVEEEQPVDWPLIVAGAAGAGAGIGVGAALGGNESNAESTGMDPTRLDRDGDGFTVGEGDCDDSNPLIRPDGAISFDVRFAFSGTVDCQRTNPQQQTYTIHNNSCSQFSFTQLEWQVSIVDTSGRTTNTSTTFLPVDVNVVGPGQSAIIRRGPLGGTSQALCRDLSGPNPFARPRGDLRVKEVYRIIGGARDLRSTNNFLVLNTIGCSFCSLDTIFGPYPLTEPASASPQAPPPIAWVNELNVAGGIGRVILNGERTISVGPGYSKWVGLGRRGENTLEAILVSGEGKPGTWRFEFESTEGFETGQLRVKEGEVFLPAPHTVLVRFNGKPGERGVFTFSIRR